MLAYKGAPDYDKDAVWRYQDERWGSTTGETALVELSAVAAPSTSAAEPLRLMHLPGRIATIRARIAEHRPKNSCCFMAPVATRWPTCRVLKRWSEIAGTPLTPNVVIRRDDSAYVATPHPTAHGFTNEFWTNLGRELVSYCVRRT